MAFLRSGTGSEHLSVIEGDDITLRPPQLSDYSQWAELRQQSREHLRPWEPLWPDDDLAMSGFNRRIKHYHREAHDDLGYAFLIFRRHDDRLLGGVSLANVRRGVTQCATLGYWLGLPYVRQGFMRRAVSLVAAYAFDTLKLHRLEAATQPHNHPSICVLEANGFRREGYATRYLKINGVWSDHLLFARLADDPAGAEAARR
jgi:ribosomal-protein-alanine N-acetyltransferase